MNRKRKQSPPAQQQLQVQRTGSSTSIEPDKSASTMMTVMRSFAEQVNALGLNGLRSSFSKLRARGPHPATLTCNAQKLNPSKCRYHDVPCLDHSRVLLKPWPQGQGDFIHANWVTHELIANKFICTQGPLSNTCGDFWRMIWQENVELIIMLCRTCEENRSKCAQYWPLKPGEVLTFCGITIRAVEKRSSDPDVHCTALLMTYCGKRRSLAHYQWVSWPDRFVPNQLTVPFTLLSSARARKTPTVIHCSAGIGRTGTLVVLEIVAKTLLACRIPMLPEIIWYARSQRSRVVQNEEQYLYIHYLTLQRLVNKGIVSDKSVSKFCRDYEHFYFVRTHKKQIPLPLFGRKKKPPPTPASPKKVTSVMALQTVKKQDITTSSTTPSSPTSQTSETLKGQQTKQLKVTKRRKAKSSSEDLASGPPPQQRASETNLVQATKSEADLQREYREAQYALLETYRKAQLALLKTYERKYHVQSHHDVSKIDHAETNAASVRKKTPTAASSVPEKQSVAEKRADQSVIEKHGEQSVSEKRAEQSVSEKRAEQSTAEKRAEQSTAEKYAEQSPTEKQTESSQPTLQTSHTDLEATEKAWGEDENPQSIYAYTTTDEVNKIKNLDENKESGMDDAGYVFMEPIYAKTYGAEQDKERNPDVVEKYVMNMLPEKYFNAEVDDGAEYAAGVPPAQNKPVKEVSEQYYINIALAGESIDESYERLIKKANTCYSTNIKLFTLLVITKKTKLTIKMSGLVHLVTA